MWPIFSPQENRRNRNLQVWPSVPRELRVRARRRKRHAPCSTGAPGSGCRRCVSEMAAHTCQTRPTATRAVLQRVLRKDALRSSKIRPDRRVCGCGSARAGAHPARGPRGLRPPRCLANRDPSRWSQRSGCSRRTADVGLAGLAVHEGVDRVHRHAPVSLWRLVAITLWSRCSWLRAARPWNGAKKTGAVAAASFRRRRRRRRQTCETVGRIRQVVVTAF